MKKRFLYIIPIVAVAIAATAFWAIPSSTSAVASPVERIAELQFAAFGDEAVLCATPPEIAGETDRIRYHSDKTGRDYYYLADGSLLSIHGNSSSDAEPLGPIPEQAELDQQMLEFAGNCILPNQLGELVQNSVETVGDEYRYIFRELYDGAETGTGVWLRCRKDGTVTYAAVSIGSSYEKAEDGEVKALYDVSITEEKAWEIARNALMEQIAGTGYEVQEDTLTMTREARGGQQFYTMTAKTYSEKEHYTVTYLVHVDVSDGSVPEIIRSL